MPLIALTKSDGLVLNTPAGSITGIYSTAFNTEEENRNAPGARCVITTNVRGMSTYALAHPARDVLEQIKAGIGKAKPQEFIILAAGDDINAIQRSAVLQFEEIKRGDELLLLVHFNRHDGQSTQVLASACAENKERLEALSTETE